MRHWIEYRHWMEYVGAWAVLKLLGLLPRPAAHQLATLPARLFYWATPRLRQIADKNLMMALPELSASERSSLCWGTYRSLGRLLAEFSQFPRLNPENVRQVVAYEGLENYQAALAQKRGVLFLTAHLGAWELGAFAHGLNGYRLHIVHRPLDNPLLNRLVNRYRTLGGNKMIEKKDFARGILTALAKNETVGILADQNAVREEGVFVNFFGIPACTTAGIAKIALHSGAAVVPAFCVYDSKTSQFHICFDPPLRLETSGDAEEDIRAATQQMAGVIERFVRRYPGQWLWIHRRWKTRPPGEPPIYS
ncbi:MAG: lysophospholipid acyltransferase family protein [Acidobacteria bacterium]|nr:lysophospholipid acyltransferase family protein [Acidobacteriota bacterium]